MQATVTVESSVVESPRVQQVRGLFDLAAEKTSRLQWTAALPIEERPWNIGLITGPSGCGKSTLRAASGRARRCTPPLSPGRAIARLLDAFPESASIKDVTALLSAVGFSSPPAWLRPFHVLSTGQQFRVTLARLLAEALAAPEPALVVLDEYTSVVDRTVAQIGSAAAARAVRAHNLRFIAVTCHDDVIPWLQPDWVYQPAEGRFEWRLLRRRPSVRLEIVRCQASAWPLFAAHHYLSGELAPRPSASWRRGTSGRSRSAPGCRSSAPDRRRGGNIARFACRIIRASASAMRCRL